ncbi:MAG: hypothetical protein K2Q20_12275 [Phycisphaerales bacterium]|nr:hypothetical protein [Phycisphaerales bacterium]
MRHTLLALAILLVSIIVGATATVAQAWWSCLPAAAPAAVNAMRASDLTVGRASFPENKHVTFAMMPEPSGFRRQFEVTLFPTALELPNLEPTWADRAATRGPSLGWPTVSGYEYVLKEYRAGWPADALVGDEVTPIGDGVSMLRGLMSLDEPFRPGYVFNVPTKVLPLGFASNSTIYSAPIWLPFFLWTLLVSPLRRRARVRAGRCPACGYDPGMPTANCPECGHRLAPSPSPSLPQSPTQVSHP